MIEYIRGELTELTPTLAVVETAGVGYALSISLKSSRSLCPSHRREECRHTGYSLSIPGYL